MALLMSRRSKPPLERPDDDAGSRGGNTGNGFFLRRTSGANAYLAQGSYMNLKSGVKIAVAAALLGAVSIPALATTVVPPSTGPTPTPGLGNGGLVVEVYDLTTGTALTEWLGGDIGTFGAPSATPAGGETLDYGTLGGSEFATLFSASEVAAGDVVFAVSAANDAGTLPTMDLTLSKVGTITQSTLTAIAQANQTGIASIMNGTTACNNANPCLVTSGGSTNGNWAVTQLGASLGGLASTSSAGGTAGGAGVNFYQIVGSGSSSISKQTLVQFANATGAATWTLSATGDLQYNVPGGTSPVPLPAAVWLLGSGLLGLAGIGRRKLLAA